MTGQPASVVVIGGGLAGITAAIALSEAGASVTLLEARPRLGGATCSFSRDGLIVDNGQHVFLRCCTAYRGLLARLGMAGSVTLQDRFDVTVASPGGRARLRRTGLPGPLHMGAALAGYRLLSYSQRLRVARAALAMTALDPARGDLDATRLGDWLAAHGQDERTRRVLWDLFTVSSLNVPGDDASLALAATVVKTALLGARDAADIGVPAIPLGDLHGRAAAALLGRQGAQVRLGAKVAAVSLPPGGHGGANGSTARLRVQLAERRGNGGPTAIEADGIVLAVPPEAAARLMPAGAPAGHPGPAQWRQLATSPIVNVHVIYDRRVTRLPFVAAVDSPVQWVFDRTGPSGLRTGQYLAISLSAADSYVDVPAPALREQFLPALAELFPAARDARVTDFFVTRERRATLRQVPGCERLRPPAATAVPGLVLAGAWTGTGWPDTMEGAVRSGLNAVRALRRDLAMAGGGAPASNGRAVRPARLSGVAGAGEPA
ncbi:MAG TPA: hydroxysqualene dehydroxylase HpnE [Streptosporangiaceae bacterium]|nr:hydroxysqualene dehydroxylase HpnE [Streptosporangiaceae bacterium]